MHKSPKSPSCACGLPHPYAACCGRYHAGEAAPSAEALMRSRYTAYVLGLEDYLLATWHASTRPEALGLADDAPAKWLGLEIRRAETDGERAVVAFVARYKVGGRAHRLSETSRFVLEDGRWYYVDGDLVA
ncbi:YchJ family protein [Chitiniphilus shinanonensis]|uniref:YchJ family protein n=1 Tax=Chitiniphilus shinanonensis TaxID=553088 RepID=UPI00305D16DF